MPAWVCPKCQRQFARRSQSHECSPAMTVEEYFSTGPAHERPVYEAVMAHLAKVGPVHVEPVQVGIFLKRAGTFAELRPMAKWVALSFSLPRPVPHKLVKRRVMAYHGRYFHVANVSSPAELDDALFGLLTEAYLTSPA